MEELELVQELRGHEDTVWSVAWSPSGETLASCSCDKTVRIWTRPQNGDTDERWACVAVLEDFHHRTIRSVSWSPDGRCLATASFDATSAIWEVKDGKWEHVAVLEGHENEVKCVAWSPSGTLLATCGRDKTVWIWEAEPGHSYECVDVKYGHSQDVKSVVWHPSGEVLVSCSYDDSVRLWVDAHDEWVCHQTLSGPGLGHEATVWSAAFSRDGSRMATCSDDATLRLWECRFARGFREPSWRLQATLSGHHEMTIYSVDWSADGLLATGCRDNGIRVFREAAAAAGAEGGEPGQPPGWELLTRRQQAHSSDVNCVRWHPTQPGLLASAGDDGSVRLWRLRERPPAPPEP